MNDLAAGAVMSGRKPVRYQEKSAPWTVGGAVVALVIVGSLALAFLALLFQAWDAFTATHGGVPGTFVDHSPPCPTAKNCETIGTFIADDGSIVDEDAMPESVFGLGRTDIAPGDTVWHSHLADSDSIYSTGSRTWIGYLAIAAPIGGGGLAYARYRWRRRQVIFTLPYTADLEAWDQDRRAAALTRAMAHLWPTVDVPDADVELMGNPRRPPEAEDGLDRLRAAVTRYSEDDITADHIVDGDGEEREEYITVPLDTPALRRAFEVVAPWASGAELTDPARAFTLTITDDAATIELQGTCAQADLLAEALGPGVLTPKWPKEAKRARRRESRILSERGSLTGVGGVPFHH